MHSFIDDLVNLIALALSAGDAFLPSAVEYDDLFYKLVEAGDILVKFRDSCKLSLLLEINSDHSPTLPLCPSDSIVKKMKEKQLTSDNIYIKTVLLNVPRIQSQPSSPSRSTTTR